MMSRANHNNRSDVCVHLDNSVQFVDARAV